MNSILSNLIETAQVWQAGQFKSRPTRAISSGWDTLDQSLPGRGWPQGALTELLCDTPGIGELKLLLPAIKTVISQGRYVFWIDPPFTPCATALVHQNVDLAHLIIIHTQTLKEGLWSLEQILQSHSCGIVIAWPNALSPNHTRRLQLAAEQTESIAFLFRSAASAAEHSPAALRLSLQPAEDSLGVSIIKRRGGWAVKQQRLDVGQQALISSSIDLPQHPVMSPSVSSNARQNESSINQSKNLVTGPWPHHA